MKTTFKYLMAAAVLAAGFTGCSKDDVSGGGSEELGDRTYMTLTITEPSTYATTDSHAKENEAKINDVSLYFYNGTTLLESMNIPLDSLDVNNPSAGSGADSYRTFTIKALSNANRLYVGLNIPSTMSGKVPNQEVDLGNTTNPVSYLMLPNFAMLNKEVRSMTLQEVNEGDPIPASNKVTVQVERMVAKVDVQKGAQLPSETAVSNAKISADLAFSMGAMNTKTYPMRRADGKDPNWDDSNFSSLLYSGEFYYEFLTTQPTAGSANFAHSNITMGAYTNINEIATTKESRNVKYTPENTAEVPRQGVSTYTSIKAKFVPDYTNGWDGTNITETPYTGSDAPDDLFVCVDEYGKYYFFEDKDDAEAAMTPADGFGHYEKGLCYYTVFLNNQVDGNTYRNDLYKVTVTKINQLGNPNPGEPNPGEEIIKKRTDIEVTIEVLHWNLIESNEELSK